MFINNILIKYRNNNGQYIYNRAGFMGFSGRRASASEALEARRADCTGILDNVHNRHLERRRALSRFQLQRRGIVVSAQYLRTTRKRTRSGYQLPGFDESTAERGGLGDVRIRRKIFRSRRAFELSGDYRCGGHPSREKEMIHFVYLFAFAIFVSVAFSIFANGTNKERIIYGLKIFAQFVIISLVLAWIFYFIPW